MHRHTFLLVPAPGRVEEAVSALSAWLEQVEHLPGFHGGAVLREYAGEFKGFPDVLTLTYDLDAETRHEFWEAAKALPDPMRPDIGDETARVAVRSVLGMLNAVAHYDAPLARTELGPLLERMAIASLLAAARGTRVQGSER